VVLPDPFQEMEAGRTLRIHNSRATAPDLDQKSKMAVELKKDPNSEQSRRR